MTTGASWRNAAHLFTAVSIVALVAISTSANACTCQAIEDPNEALALSDWVMRGRVASMRDLSLPDGSSALLVTLDVDRVWKGTVPSRAYLLLRDLCSPVLTTGEEYYLFADFSDAIPDLSICKPNIPTRVAPASFRRLGPGYRPIPAVLLALLVVGALLAMTTALWKWRQWRVGRSASPKQP